MYRPYVGNKTVGNKHLPTILDIEIEYPQTHPRLWLWLALAAAGAALAAAAWSGRIAMP